MKWKPIRRGPIYCSPACGADCTYENYRKAQAAAKACLARMKTRGWTIRMNENMGWFWSLENRIGGAVISIRGGQLPYGEPSNRNFYAMLSQSGHSGSCDAVWHSDKRFDDPNDAVRHQLKVAKRYVTPINKLLAQLENSLCP